MTVKIEQVQDKTNVVLIIIEGDLDASNYKEVINIAKEALKEGAKKLLIDMSRLEFMSSAGLIAIHSIALLFRGVELPESEDGWEAFRALDRDRGSGIQENVKLLNPQPNVKSSLEMTSIIDFFAIHTDLDTAIASFN